VDREGYTGHRRPLVDHLARSSTASAAIALPAHTRFDLAARGNIRAGRPGADHVPARPRLGQAAVDGNLDTVLRLAEA